MIAPKSSGPDHRNAQRALTGMRVPHPQAGIGRSLIAQRVGFPDLSLGRTVH